MGKYVPLAITYANSGLVKDKDAFVLSDDAYQNLENIYQWRGRLRRREGYSLLGRLRRTEEDQEEDNTDGTNQYNIPDLLTAGLRGVAPDATIEPGSVSIVLDGTDEFTDDTNGTLTRTAGATYDVYPAQNIMDITQAAAGVIEFTGAHTFVATNQIRIQGVSGMTEINDTIVTVTAVTGTTVTTNLDTSAFTAYTSGGTANGTWINYDTSEVNLTWLTGSTPGGAVVVTVDYSYYPSLPVMGLPQRELNDINAEQTVAFDTVYPYSYSNANNRFEELNSNTPINNVTWQGSDTDFFYSVSYWYTSDRRQYFWTTNFNHNFPTNDPIRVYDGQEWWTFQPDLDGSGSPQILYTCRMIIPYKGRLVVLNTWEGTTEGGAVQYAQRARWSQNGSPFSSVAQGTVPVVTEEWRSDVKGRGGFVDCPTNEHIISAQFIRDLLVVGFENSTWALRYTGNEILPFVWERINKELGSESTFSMVAFDRGVLYVGDKSINSCNGNNVERIDENIPDEVFNIHNSVDPDTQVSDGPLRVHGKRDFFERLVYWTFPDASTEARYPDRLLVFNYHNYTWSIFTDSFTALGEYQRFNDIRWSDLNNISWQEANFSWVTAQLQSQFPNIIGGNQQGFVEVMHSQVANDVSLQITDVTGGTDPVVLEVPSHNLQTGEFILIDDILGTGGDELNGRVFRVDVDDVLVSRDEMKLFAAPRTDITAITQSSRAVVTAPGHTFTVGQHWYIDRITAGMVGINGLNGTVFAVNGNDVTLDVDSSTFSAYTSGGEIQNLDALFSPQIVQERTYLGKGTISRVMGFSAISKKFNMIDRGKKNYLGYIDFLSEVTENGEVSCSVFTDYDDVNPINDGSDDFFNTFFPTKPDQFSVQAKTKEWHRFYCTTDAQFFQYDLNLSERQLCAPNIVNSNVLIDAIIIYSEQGGRLID